MVVEGISSGMHASPNQGMAVEFAEHRPYTPGESLRHLDWKMFGRSDKLYIKRYQQETSLDVVILVDSSNSMRFSTLGTKSGWGGTDAGRQTNQWTKFDCAAAITVAPTEGIPQNSANVPSSGLQRAGSIPRKPGPFVGDGNSVHPYVSDVNQGHQKKMLNKITSVTAAAVVGIATTVAGIVRGQIGKMELDQVQSNRAEVATNIREQVRLLVDDWGIEVTRAEILDVNLDEATRTAMLQQLNAERARRAQVTEAEGKKRAVELNADAELYAAEQESKARRILADAEAYATAVIAEAIKANGIEAAQYQVALKQVEALTAVGQGAGKQMIIVPAQALDAFGDAFKMLKGRL